MTPKEKPLQKDRADLSDYFINYNLRKARRNFGYTLRKLSELSGVNYILIEDYERLRIFPSKKNAEKIANVLNKNTDEIFPVKIKYICKEVNAIRNKGKDILDNAESLSKECCLTYNHDYNCNLENVELRDRINKVLNCLTNKEKQTIELRFGLSNYKVHTLEEIGDMFNLSKEGIRQIEKKVKIKLKYKLTSEY